MGGTTAADLLVPAEFVGSVCCAALNTNIIIRLWWILVIFFPGRNVIVKFLFFLQRTVSRKGLSLQQDLPKSFFWNCKCFNRPEIWWKNDECSICFYQTVRGDKQVEWIYHGKGFKLVSIYTRFTRWCVTGTKQFSCPFTHLLPVCVRLLTGKHFLSKQVFMVFFLSPISSSALN